MPFISIATSVKYGNYKQYLENCAEQIELFVDKFDEIKSYIKLPRNLFIHYRPSRRTHGVAYTTKIKGKKYARAFWVEYDVRQDLETYKDTMLHELVHIEQFYQRRLVDIGQTFFKWNGEKVSAEFETFEEYDNLPWEREAIQRAKYISQRIF